MRITVRTPNTELSKVLQQSLGLRWRTVECVYHSILLLSTRNWVFDATIQWHNRCHLGHWSIIQLLPNQTADINYHSTPYYVDFLFVIASENMARSLRIINKRLCIIFSDLQLCQYIYITHYIYTAHWMSTICVIWDNRPIGRVMLLAQTLCVNVF